MDLRYGKNTIRRANEAATEKWRAQQLNLEVIEVAEKMLAALLTATVTLDTSRSPETWKQGLVTTAFDMAERFIAECERRNAEVR